jgi:hypothetical protein
MLFLQILNIKKIIQEASLYDSCINYDNKFLEENVSSSSETLLSKFTHHDAYSEDLFTISNYRPSEVNTGTCIFRETLMNKASQRYFNSREFLKHSFNELIGCLDSYRSHDWNDHIQESISNLVEVTRNKLGENKRKCDVLTMNVMTEQEKKFNKKKICFT